MRRTAVLRWQKFAKIDDQRVRRFIVRRYLKQYKKKNITVYTNTFY